MAGSAVPLAECLPKSGTPEFLPTLEELVHIQLDFARRAHAESGIDRPALIEELLATEPRDIPISEFSEGSDWLNGERLGSFDSHHEIPIKQEKDVLFLSVNSVNDAPFISPRNKLG